MCALRECGCAIVMYLGQLPTVATYLSFSCAVVVLLPDVASSLVLGEHILYQVTPTNEQKEKFDKLY